MNREKYCLWIPFFYLPWYVIMVDWRQVERMSELLPTLFIYVLTVVCMNVYWKCFKSVWICCVCDLTKTDWIGWIFLFDDDDCLVSTIIFFSCGSMIVNKSYFLHKFKLITKILKRYSIWTFFFQEIYSDSIFSINIR